MPRFYIPFALISGHTIALPDASAHHAARVLRLALNDAIILFDGSGQEWDARICHIDKRTVEVSVGAARSVSRESALQITLAQGISSGERMDYTLQKAVELGVYAIQPIACARSVVKLSGERADKRLAHWHNLIIAACEQSGRNIVPDVHPINSLPGWVIQAEAPLKLMFAPDAEHSLHTLPRPTHAVLILAGPEGGFAPDETAAALAAGFTPIRLGPRILRTETAALAALAAMQTLWGDL